MKEILDEDEFVKPTKPKYELDRLTAILFLFFTIGAQVLFLAIIANLTIPEHHPLYINLDEFIVWNFLFVLVLIPLVFFIGTFHVTHKSREESFDLLFYFSYGLSIFFGLMIIGILLFGGGFLFGF